ncbi:uncharacterized protein LOC130897380 [Diorhabda carinulata]|uniref:uncharacterized protein LOC130897380 n=1 Tax=Diorhabda carinulata TaxID=1163345 RepID=UPI00259FFAD0|nr:uncharacterized protein LOC130897380 [Diorhabda carinulata]
MVFKKLGVSFDYKEHINEGKMCICKTLSPVFTFLKLFGYFPIRWKHEKHICVYEKSPYWLIYTAFIFGLQIYLVFTNINYKDIVNTSSLLLLLNNLTNAIYGHYIIIVTAILFVKYPSYIEALNKLIATIIPKLFCQSAMKRVHLLQYVKLISLLLVILFQIATYIWFIYYGKFDDNLNASNVIYRLLSNLPFVFYCLLFTIFGMIIAILVCFEKFTIGCLKYVPVHPMKDIDTSSNSADFMGVVHYELCTENHPGIPQVMDRRPAEIVEYLRIYHEEISLCIYDWNKCMDPYFILHTIVELGVLIIHWYAVIAYMVYSFKDARAPTIHFLNCVFAISHTCGLYLFLKNAQYMKNTIFGLIDFLLEYSTRITDPDEHQQVRFFIEKIKNHRPFTANGIFTIDLGVAGPISANLLTYVLVALQFEIPKE